MTPPRPSRRSRSKTDSTILEIPRLDGATRVTGIFGYPLTATLSPRMHNHAFKRLKLDYIYLPFAVPPNRLKAATESIRSQNIAGVNVTIPHKQTIIPYLDSLTSEAGRIGAVNTVINRRGRLIGDNTDSRGFMNSLTTDGKYDPRGKTAVLWGSGGAAYAMASALLRAGVRKLFVSNRTSQRAKDLVDHFKKPAGTEFLALEPTSSTLLHALSSCDIFLNATPTGSKSDSFPIPPDRFVSPKKFVYDAVYLQTTPLIAQAERAGARTLGGLGMLVRQGALSFSLWTDQDPPVDLMFEALR